jgi:formylglycine-generating enzyme required for sulfatase activity/serine/threonine protein kinase
MSKPGNDPQDERRGAGQPVSDDAAKRPQDVAAAEANTEPPAADPTTVKTTHVIDGVYVLRKKIGQGGMATVYLADVDLTTFNYTYLYAYTQVQAKTHTERLHTAEAMAAELRSKTLDVGTMRSILEVHRIPLPPAQVAVKVATGESSVQRFEGEWKNLLCLNHDNLVKVYGGGIYSKRPYYAMELLRNIVPPERIKEKFTIREKLDVIVQAGRGLQYLHDNGLIHRDVKPANMVTCETAPGQYVTKVTDLGLAKSTEEDLGLTKSGAVMGSPYYMSPEQVASTKNADHRSDVYSLGASLYELVTGVKPYHDKTTVYEIISAISMGTAPIPPREHLPDMPEAIAAIIECAMARNPRKRYGKVSDMIADIEQYLTEESPALIASVFLSATDRPKSDAKVGDGHYTFEKLGDRKGARTRARTAATPPDVDREASTVAMSTEAARYRKAGSLVRRLTRGPLAAGAAGVAILLLIWLFWPSSGSRGAKTAGRQTAARKPGAGSEAGRAAPGPAKMPDKGTPTVPTSEPPPEVRVPAPREEQPMPSWAQGCVLAWSFNRETLFDRDGKKLVRDLSGNGHDGLVAGDVRGGLKDEYLVANGQGVSAAAHALAQPKQMTIGVWLRGGPQTEWARVLHKVNWDGKSGYGLFVNGRDAEGGKKNGICIELWGQDGKMYGAFSKTVITDNQWHHALATYDGVRLCIYVDGRLDNAPTDVQKVAIKPTDRPLRLGEGEPENPRCFKGDCEEVAIWDRVLSDAEIAGLYRYGKAGNSACQAIGDVAQKAGWVSLFDGKSLGGWKVVEQFSVPAGFGDGKGGAASVRDGQLILERGQPATGVAWTGEFPRTNYELSLEAMRVSGNDSFCAIVFPVGHAHTNLTIGGYGGAAVGLEGIDDRRLDQSPAIRRMTFETGRWYRVLLRVTAERIEAHIDKEKVVDLPLAGHDLGRFGHRAVLQPFGIGTFATTGAFRDIRFRRLGGGEGTVQYTNPLGMEFVKIPAGEFMMGSTDAEIQELLANVSDQWGRMYISSQGPRHRVRLTRDFFMAKYEVTVGHFGRFVESAKYVTDAEKRGAFVLADGKWQDRRDANWQNPYFEQTPQHPVSCVTLADARAFCCWLNETDAKRPAGYDYRLPTEAEWEYTARGPGGSRYPWGGDWDPSYCNYADKRAVRPVVPTPAALLGDDGYAWTSPVGSYSPRADSPFGIADMAGNLWEMCEDIYAPDYYKQSPASDPVNGKGESRRSVRGGSWAFSAVHCRGAWRFMSDDDARYPNVGFRVALVPKPQDAFLRLPLDAKDRRRYGWNLPGTKDRFGIEGAATAFDGQCANLRVSEQPTGPFTVSVWARFDGPEPKEEWSNFIFHAGGAEPDNYVHFGIRIRAEGQYAGKPCWVWDHSWRDGKGGGGGGYCLADEPLLSRRWTHLAATFDGQRYRLYVDGKVQTDDLTGGLPRFSEMRAIGGSVKHEPKYFFHGGIGDLRIAPGALSADQINGLCHEGGFRAPPGPHDMPAKPAEFAGHCYHVFHVPGELSWQEAQKACRALGGTLACIETKEENDFLARLTGDRQLWIGLNDFGEEGQWQWINGSPVPYTNWQPGQPDGGRDQQGVTMRKGGVWGDDHHEMDFICEWAGLTGFLHVALKGRNPAYNGNGQFTLRDGKIVEANLASSGLVDLSPLQGLPLEKLDLRFCREVSDLQPLQGAPLKHLVVQGSKVSTLAPLKGMPLGFIDITECASLTDISALKGMPLTAVNLHSCPRLESIEALARMKLTVLNIEGCSLIADISPLKGMSLEYLHLRGTKVRDMSPVKGMPLERLFLVDAPVADLSPLEGARLELLDLHQTPVTDLTPLANMPLETLILDPRRIRKGIEVIRAMRTLEHIGTNWNEKDQPATDFWKKYDAGAFR